MSIDKTGGPAFPDPGRAQSAKQREQLTNVGISTRDYFAAKALPRVIGSLVAIGDPEWQSDAAWLAYSMADAMLRAREQS